MRYANKLSGKSILIFGADSSIGRSTAEACIEYGARLTITTSCLLGLEHALGTLRQAYPFQEAQITGYVCDTSTPAHHEARFKAVLDAVTKSRANPLDHVILAPAPPSYEAPPLDASVLQDIERLGGTTLLAGAALARVVSPYLGTVTLPASRMSSLTLTCEALPSRTFWSPIDSAIVSGMEGLVRGLAVELAPRRVNAVAHGAVSSKPRRASSTLRPMSFAEMMMSDDSADGSCDVTPFPANGSGGAWMGYGEPDAAAPSDVAEAYLYAMRDGSLTGQVLRSDGGLALAGQIVDVRPSLSATPSGGWRKSSAMELN